MERARGQQRTELGPRACKDRRPKWSSVGSVSGSVMYAVTKKLKNPEALLVSLPLSSIPRGRSIVIESKVILRLDWRKLRHRIRRDQALNIKGFIFVLGKAFYPNQSVAGAVIGFAGMDGTGLEGIERDFESLLRGTELKVKGLRDALGQAALPSGSIRHTDRVGATVELTLDTRIQQLAERVLIEQVDQMKAEGGVVVVMDPYSGDLLAVAQTPAFDPNQFRSSQPGDWRNRSVTDVLEPGSTIKPLLIASALMLKLFVQGRSLMDIKVG